LPAASRHSRFEPIVPALLAATVLAFAAGSSSLSSAVRVGHPARWVALALLFCAALAWARRDLAVTLPRAATAASAALVALALVSATWSVAPRLTAERALSLGLLLATGLLLACAVRSANGAERLLAGLLAGAVAVTLAGLLVLAFAHGHAVTPASYETPARFQGFGENPNTGALLFALALPLAAWALLAARGIRLRVASAVALALLFGSIVASGSRGALAAAALGALVPGLSWAATARRRLAVCAATAALAGAGAVVQQLPQAAPLHPERHTHAHTAQASPKPPRYLNADSAYPLDADVGGPLPGGGQPALRRSFLSSSGRITAWRGALDQAAQRPLFGYGFGTEARVFVDRFYYFVGGLPENSYIGITLQLGLAGLLALLGLVALLAASARGARDRLLVAAPLGVVVAGLVMAGVQSYLYSVGNIASATFWIAAFLVPAAARSGR
jgi:O-antigen ligase